jgi:hypothetical protein
MEFIRAVLDNKIEFKNRKKAEVSEQIIRHTQVINEEDIDRLLRINILSLTDEMVKQLEKEIEQAKKDHKYWSSTNPDKQFLNDLEELA